MEFFDVAEHFLSINGEGKKAGRLAYFIRLGGCNLNCSFCDTRWASDRKRRTEHLSGADLVKCVKDSGAKLVTITGGEPLLCDEIGGLFGMLLADPQIEVEVETNGSVSIRPFRDRDARLCMTMDYKLPGSNMEEAMDLSNMEELKPWDVVKFVIGSREDLLRAEEIVDRFSLCERSIVYFSPVFGQIDPEVIVSFMKERKLDKVRFQIQIHKVVWDPEKKGV